MRYRTNMTHPCRPDDYFTFENYSLFTIVRHTPTCRTRVALSCGALSNNFYTILYSFKPPTGSILVALTSVLFHDTVTPSDCAYNNKQAAIVSLRQQLRICNNFTLCHCAIATITTQSYHVKYHQHAATVCL